MSKATGRKIYRNSTNAKRKRVKKAIGIFVSILVLAILTFIGYSIAKPIYNYFSTESANQQQVSPWIPPVIDDPQENTETLDKNTETDIIEPAETTLENNNKSINDGFTAYQLPEDALTSQEKLNDYITRAKSQGYNALIVTMKSSGGKINYLSASEFAAKDENVVVGSLSAQQISDSIKSNNMFAVAALNLLEDNNRYGENRDGSYHNTDGTTWLDNSVQKGGKPWLSPFENDTTSYAAFLVNEVTTAGFDAVIADGLKFPQFRNSDLNLLGDSVKSPERYKALINLAKITNSVTASRNTPAMISLNAADILNGKEEIFKQELFTSGYPIIIEYFPIELENIIIYNNQEIVLSDLTESEKFNVIFKMISEMSNNQLQLIPSFKYSDYDQAEFDKVVTILINENYSSYIVQ